VPPIDPRLRLPGPRPWILAHRGASDREPENTLAAFRRALDDGADLIETDLWWSADGELVCHHDATARRMTGDPRRIDQLRVAQLQALRVRAPRAGRGAAATVGTIPTLAELFALVGERVPLVLELKDPRFRARAWAERFAAAVGPRAAAGRVAVIAFDRRALAAVRAAAPGLICGHVSLGSPVPRPGTELLGPFAPLLRLHPGYVAAAHRQGQIVCPLDPQLHSNLGRWLALDVDAVLTNEPAGTRRAIAALRAARGEPLAAGLRAPP